MSEKKRGEVLLLQEQHLLMFQVQKQKEREALAQAQALVVARRETPSVNTVEDDGLSVPSLVPAHVLREQQELYEQLATRASTSSTPRSVSRATLLHESSVHSIGSSSRRSRVRGRSSLDVDAYSLPAAHSASTDHQAHLNASSSSFGSGMSSRAAVLPHSPTEQQPQPLSPAEQQARADRQAKQQAQLPQVAQALAQRRAQRSTTAPPPPTPPPLPLPPERPSSPQEIDVDDLVVERRTSYNHNQSSSFSDFRVGAFNIRNAGEPPVHPNDTQPQSQSQSQRSILVPPVIQQQLSESEQSTITQSLSTITPRTNFTNEPMAPLASVLHTTGALSLPIAEPCALPLPAAIVGDSTTVIIAGPPNPDGNGGPAANSHPEHKKQPPQTEQKSTTTYVLGGGGFFVLVGGIFLLLCLYVPAFQSVGIYKGREETAAPSAAPTSVAAPTLPPTPRPTLLPTPYVLDLPAFTLSKIQSSPVDPNNEMEPTPQARAYQWLLQDIALYPDRSIERQYQRFALATLYYATNLYGTGEVNGEVDNSLTEDAWKRSVGWLDHDMHECEWETVGTTGRELEEPYQVCQDGTGLYESLVLEDNGLLGSIPPELSFMTTLKYLNFGRNELQYASQCIPSQLGLLTNLEIFMIFFSYCKGPLPSEIGRWTKLKTLTLEWNQLASTVPSQIGQLTNLQELVLKKNRLQGTLPSELGLPLQRNLWNLNVESNLLLNGTIPDSFNEAMAIRKDGPHGPTVSYNGNHLNVDLRGNSFTGTVPDEMCSLQQRLDFDCPDVCGCDCDCVEAAVEDQAAADDQGNPEGVFP